MSTEVLVLSEDGSPAAFDTVRAVLQALRKHVGAVGDAEWLDWRSVNRGAPTGSLLVQRHTRVDLVRAIARELKTGRLIVLHLDMNEPWSNRARSDTLGHAKKMQEAVARHSGDARARGFVVLLPAAEIEAWLFQAVGELRTFGRQNKWEAPVLALLDRWEADRKLLDEVPDPKAAIPSRRPPNQQLARHVPIGAVVAAEKSLAEAARTIRGAPPPLGCEG